MTRAATLALAALVLSACEAPPHPPPTVPVVPVGSATTAAASCVDLQPYVPKPAYTGTRPALPSPDGYVPRPIKVGDAYTVWGAIHQLHSRVHAEEVNGQKITIVGTIVRTNYLSAPRCAVHRTGRGDPADCRAPVPAFSLADDASGAEAAIEVMGWASNFAQVFSMIERVDRAKGQPVRLLDEFWGMPLPDPLPTVGAKVRVTGTYAITFTKATSGAAVSPKTGILTAETVETLEPGPVKATLPGMKP